MLVVIGNKSGKLANRLFVFSHFIANSIDKSYPLLNTSFAEYSKYFISTASNDFGPYNIRISTRQESFVLLPVLNLLRRLLRSSRLHRCWSIKGDQEVNLSADIDYEYFRKYKYLFFYGWGFRDYAGLEKHADKMREFFAPLSSYRDRIEEYLSKSRAEGSILFGVHIRRGDYREWRGGQYFFEDTVYAEKMAQIVKQCTRSRRNVQFLLCSNEKLDYSCYDGFDFFRGTGHELEDLYTLAKCDYIIGPPSTYSMWASYYGKVPLYYLENPNATIALTDFKVFCS